MKTNVLYLLLLVSLFTTAVSAQTPLPANGEPRITFMLKNTLGYSRMFLAVGPGMAYGFSMGKRQTVPCNWPIGSKLYFTQDGKVGTGLILTVTAADEGKTLTTDTGATEIAPTAAEAAAKAEVSAKKVAFRLRNPSLLPQKITLISYEPGEIGNSTIGFVMRPKGTTSFRFPIGTKLYIADKEQVDVVMSGKRLDSSKAFMTVKAEDAGKAFDVN
ncbi:MAG: hypothetical protein H7Z72_07580 [Bacteroidetes bacterium]|nr:hypothetical protein [Fibrella sp.]